MPHLSIIISTYPTSLFACLSLYVNSAVHSLQARSFEKTSLTGMVPSIGHRLTHLLSKCFAGINEVITHVAFVFLFLFEVKCQLGCIHMKVFQSQTEIIWDYFIFGIILAYRESPCTNTSFVSLPIWNLIKSRKQEFLLYPRDIWKHHSSFSLYC